MNWTLEKQGKKLMEILSKRSKDGTWTRSGPKKLMVTEESATRTGLPDTLHQHIPLNADHSDLVKFESPSHGGYEIVMQNIKNMRQRHQRQFQNGLFQVCKEISQP
jgi:hypothetical protein